MTLIRKLESIVLFLLTVSAGYGQASFPKTLLWRISGHGLSTPSYLYGTMHLNDKRLFKFGDSVYHAIEQSAGLAIEVNPDEMGAYYANKLFDQIDNIKKLTDILNEKDFKKYSTSLSKKFKKPAASITASDIVKEKNKWMSEYMEKGEMPTFLDAYLYNIARRQGKWLGGIEDMADQAGLMEDMVDKSDIEYLLVDDDSSVKSAAIDKGLQRMINLYSEQDLEGIQAISETGSTAGQRDRMLIKRNVKMARRIDSLTSLRSMFLAIGAAHLPGDSGVIYLLRKRGFTVEPVYSSNKIDAKDYTFKEVRIPWYKVDDSQGFYQALMPGNPATVKLLGLIEMKFLLDIFNMSSYCTMVVQSPTEFSNPDSIYNSMASRMFQTDAKLPSRIIHVNGVEGRSFQQKVKGTNLRAALFIYQKKVYCAFLGSLKAETLNSADADKFFASFSINKDAVGATTSTVFIDSTMGIACEVPAAITYNKKMSSETESWKVSTFTGTDPASGSYIMIFSKELRPGRYITADSIIYQDFFQFASKQYHIIQKDEKRLQGVLTVSASGQHLQQPGLYMNAVTLLKNGRVITILTISDSANLHSSANDRIFQSLRFIDHPATIWKNQTSPNNTFSCFAPSAIRSFRSTASNKEQFYAYDTSTAVSYSIVPDTLSKYFWTKDDTSYWNKRAADNTGSDTVLQKSLVKNADMRGIELLTKGDRHDSRYRRMRLLQDGRQLYKIFVCAEKDLLYSNEVNNFFDSFRIAHPAANDQFISTDKTDLLMEDLLSGESTTRYAAYQALAAAPFTEMDRDALQKALLKLYQSPFNNSARGSLINESVARHLAALPGNTSVEFVKSAWTSLIDKDDTLKNVCLGLLAQIHTKESYNVIKNLLRQSPFRLPFEYTVLNGFKDSLSLAAVVYPGLQQLAGDTVHTMEVAAIANSLLDSSALVLDSIRPAEHSFVSAAKALLPALVKGKPGNYRIYELITLLGRFRDPRANQVLNSYLSVKEHYLRKQVALELLKNNQPVQPAVFDILAGDKALRRSLYTDLKELKRKALFPPRYLTQASFAEAIVYNAATDADEDEELSGTSFIGRKTAVYNNKTYTFYLYKVVFAGDDTAAYLGIAGGFSAAGTAVEPLTELSGVYRKKEFDAKDTTGLLKAYLKDMEGSTDSAE